MENRENRDGFNPRPDADGDLAAIRQQKQVLRGEMQLKRESLMPDQLELAARAVRRQVMNLLSRLWPVEKRDAGRPLRVSVYSAIRGELDLTPLFPALQALPGELYFPAVKKYASGSDLVFCRLPVGLAPEEFLCTGCFGVPEPPEKSRNDTLPQLDLALVPGLAFDKNGNRLGWGKGYYDRFLAALNPRPLTIGIGYDFQVLENIPVTANDEKLDHIVTPSQILGTM